LERSYLILIDYLLEQRPGRCSISTVGRDEHRTVSRRPDPCLLHAGTGGAGVSKENANRRCKFVVRIEYCVLRGRIPSISTVGHINYYLLFMIDYCKRGRDGRRCLYMI